MSQITITDFKEYPIPGASGKIFKFIELFFPEQKVNDFALHMIIRRSNHHGYKYPKVIQYNGTYISDTNGSYIKFSDPLHATFPDESLFIQLSSADLLQTFSAVLSYEILGSWK